MRSREQGSHAPHNAVKLAAELEGEKIAETENRHTDERTAQQRHHLAKVDDQCFRRDDHAGELQDPSRIVAEGLHDLRVSSARRAPACWASFLLGPDALATTRSAMSTSTPKIFLWSGP